MSLLNQHLKSRINSMGFGVPLRTPSYILGYHPREEERRRHKRSYEADINNSDR